MATAADRRGHSNSVRAVRLRLISANGLFPFTRRTAGKIPNHPETMLTYQIVEDDNVVIIEPMGPLTEEDFRDLTAAVDAHLERSERLKGILVYAKEFPGWKNFGGFASHLRFVRDHHREIGKIAVASDSMLADFAPKLASHFVNAEVRGFGYGGAGGGDGVVADAGGDR